MSGGVAPLVAVGEHVCLPGDPVLQLTEEAVVSIAGGLRRLPAQPPSTGELLLSEFCAPLQAAQHPLHTNLRQFHIESPAARRYVGAAGDPVVVVVTRKVAQHGYMCFMGGPYPGYLDALAFDGATKNSRPRAEEGSVLYCHVKPRVKATYAAPTPASRAIIGVDESLATAMETGEMELSCLASEVGLTPKDWTSGQAPFGMLEGGTVLSLPLMYVRSLLAPSHTREAPATAATSSTTESTSHKRPREEGEGEEVRASYLLELLGKRVPFEICIGVNGLVWVKGAQSEVDPHAGVRRTVAVASCLTEGQADATKEEMEQRVKSYFGESS